MTARLKSAAKAAVPGALYGLYLQAINRIRRDLYNKKTAAAVFDESYRSKHGETPAMSALARDRGARRSSNMWK